MPGDCSSVVGSLMFSLSQEWRFEHILLISSYYQERSDKPSAGAV
jgi:hypothetical protein